MTEQITVEEIEKASRNVEKLSVFIGERRHWKLALDADAAASSLAGATQALAEVVGRLWGKQDPAEIEIELPPKLNPTGMVTAGRLSKFAAFIGPLRKWFAAHEDAALPADGNEAVESLLAALQIITVGVERLEASPNDQAPDDDPAAVGRELLVSGDLGPVAEVDMAARLMLDDAMATPLLQVFQGVTELTPAAIAKVDEFFNEQGVHLEDPERRRYHDKILRWIQSTPEGQVLVVRLSGLSGKVEAYSSYRPRD